MFIRTMLSVALLSLPVVVQAEEAGEPAARVKEAVDDRMARVKEDAAARMAELKASVASKVAGARDMHMHPPGADCMMKEQANLNVNFNLQAASPREAKEKFDARIRDIEQFAREKKGGKMQLQSLNYSVNTQNAYDYGEPLYQLSGNASYQLDSAEHAFALMELLSKQKVFSNVNVNMYRNSGMPCESPEVATDKAVEQ